MDERPDAAHDATRQVAASADPAHASPTSPISPPSPTSYRRATAAGRGAGVARWLPPRRRLVPAGGMLAVFCVLLWQVAGHGPVTGWDRAVRRHVQSSAHSTSWHWLTPWAHHLADLGNVAQAVPVLAVAAAFAAWRLRSWRPALLAAGAYAALLVLVVPLKVIVARPGPGSTSLHQELGYFPSGHTADAVLCLGTAALLLAACCPPRLAWLVRAAGALVVLLVGAALIWCDYHWLADVLGSLTLCGALLLLAPWPDRGAGDRAHPSSNTAGEPVPDR